MKNVIKKSVSILLAAVMLFGAAPLAGFVGIELPELNLFAAKAEAATDSGTCGDNLTWTFDEVSGELAISGTGDMTDWSSGSAVPWYSKISSIKSVSITEGVTSIGVRAFFGCTSLASITIPDSVTSIESYAFRGCTSLTSIIIPDSVTNIGYEAFGYCSGLKSVTIGKGLTSCDGNIFRKCSSLKKVHLRDGLETVFKSMFEGCKTINSITIPDSVKNIEYDAFKDCTYLATVTFGKNFEVIDNGAFMNCTSLRKINIPDSVTYIGDEAFMNCSALSEINLPERVIKMTADTFKNTSYYNNNWEDGVLYVGKHLLAGQKNIIKSFAVKEGTITIATAAFYSASLTGITIPDSVSYIGSVAFSDCRSLTSVVLPEGITRIESNTFYCCMNLRSIEIPDSVEVIEYGAFRACNYSSIVIPDSVTEIEDDAFNGCSELRVMTIGNGVKKIGDKAFSGCNKVKLINYNGTRNDWQRIEIKENNDCLDISKVNFFAESGDANIPSINGVPGYNKLLKDSSVITEPSVNTIKYGDSIILHVASRHVPTDGRIEWYSSNTNFTYSTSADGTCTVSPAKSGNTTFVAVVYDNNDTIVAVDEQEMTSKAGFFDKLSAFFRKLFGSTKVIPQAFGLIK